MMGKYVLEGMSEEARESEREKELVEKRARVKAKLVEVTERLEEVAHKRRQRMQTEMFYAQNELERVKQQLSPNPYNNQIVRRGGNPKNRSRIAAISFKCPEEPLRTTNQESYHKRSQKDADSVNGALHFGRVNFGFSSQQK